MVSGAHEALHRVFQQDTSLFARTFERLWEVSFPTPRIVSVLNADVTEVLAIERRVDTVLLVEGEEGRHVVIVEAQSGRDEDKRRSWPYYIAYLHAKYCCPVTLLVVCSQQGTAQWARRPIEIGPRGRACMTVGPFVLGPDNAPVITDVTQARTDVGFAVLSALTHRCSAQADVILKVLSAALDSLDAESAEQFAEFTEIGLGETDAGMIWRGLMAAQTYEYQSRLHTEWKAEGKAEGKIEGKIEGRAEAVLVLLERRGVSVSSSVRERVMACTDPAVLDGWLERAATAASTDDLFDD